MTLKLAHHVLPLFDGAQLTTACHQKNALLLRSLYRSSKLDDFWELCRIPINHILQSEPQNSNPYMKKTVEFIGTLCATIQREVAASQGIDNQEDLFIVQIFDYLLKYSQHDFDSIRFRSCQLISEILYKLSDFELSEEFLARIINILKQRLQDVKGVVRQVAVNALCRLQNPSDPDDELVALFVKLLGDPLAKVRSMCTEKIALTNTTLSQLILRTRDVDANIRLAALKRCETIPKRILTSERCTIFNAAISYDSQNVKKYFLEEFLNLWLEQYDNDIFQLLKCFRLVTKEAEVEETSKIYTDIFENFFFKNRSCKELMEVLPLNNNKLIPFEELNWETVVYWHLLIASFSRDAELESCIDDIAPEVVVLSEYLKSYFDNISGRKDNYLEQQWIIKHVLLIIKTMGIDDPHSRKVFLSVIEYILKNGDMKDCVLETIVDSLKLIFPDAVKLVVYGMELVSNMLYPVDERDEIEEAQKRQEKLEEIKKEVSKLKDDEREAAAVGNYNEAENIQKLILMLKNEVLDTSKSSSVSTKAEPKLTDDVVVIARGLDLVSAIWRHQKIKMSDTISRFKSEVLMDLITLDEDKLRPKVLRCLAICYLLDKTNAKVGIRIFLDMLDQEIDLQTVIVCVQAVSDLVRTYNAQMFDDEASPICLDSSLNRLISFMNHEDLDVQLHAVMGLCKIVLDDRIHSSTLLSNLIIKWCNPIDDDKPEGQTIKQIIGTVLEKVPLLKYNCDQLQECLVITLNTLANAPESSPLSTVNIDNIAQFILGLCKLSPQSRLIQSNIAQFLLNKINYDSDHKLHVTYSKMLLTMELPEDKSVLEEIMAEADEAREMTDDKTVLKNLTKYLSVVSETLASNNADLSQIQEETSEISEDVGADGDNVNQE